MKDNEIAKGIEAVTASEKDKHPHQFYALVAYVTRDKNGRVDHYIYKNLETIYVAYGQDLFPEMTWCFDNIERMLRRNNHEMTILCKDWIWIN